MTSSLATTVETATGPIEASDLGRVLMHEHVFVISTEIQQNYPDEQKKSKVCFSNDPNMGYSEYKY